MTIRKREEITRMMEHPLEEFFGIEKNSTEITKIERKTELVEYADFDTKDTELEETYQEIYDAAMSGYDNLQNMMDTAEPKFTARLAEVSVQHLNAALAAASKRAQLKENKDRLLTRQRQPQKGGGTNNTVVVMTHAELLRNLNPPKEDIVDVEVVDVPKDENK